MTFMRFALNAFHGAARLQLLGVFLVWMTTGPAAQAKTDATLSTLMTKCIYALRIGTVDAFGAGIWRPSGAPTGSNADFKVEKGSLLGLYVAKIEPVGRVCILFGYKGTADQPTLRWGQVSDTVQVWFDEQVRLYGWEDATNPIGEGFAAFFCAGPKPWMWMDVQPVWPGFRSLENASRTNLPPKKAAFRFQAHLLDEKGCAINREIVAKRKEQS